MPSDFLQLAGKRVLVMGVANRKSVAWHVGRVLVEAGAEVVYAVRSPQRRVEVAALVGDAAVFVCDVEFEDQIERLARELAGRYDVLHGLVHSIAYADYEDGVKPFHETSKRSMLRAFDISCYSLVAVSNALKELLAPDASVVTISISTTTMASENYGYMAPIKAALDSSLAFLAKSFSRFSRVRFNAVAPGLLKTSASAGIPGYVDSYLYAEQATLRKEAIRTEEVAGAAAFLLSPRSSGINAQRLVVDAGMSTNYFDENFVRGAVGHDGLAGHGGAATTVFRPNPADESVAETGSAPAAGPQKRKNC
jgi:enoyl-[acyl-carrier protein] reductase I